MNNKPSINIEYASPFKNFCMTIGELPTSYLESMSYYEMLVWLTKYLQDTVIPTVNNNADAVAELQTLFIQLENYVNNYFDNLDVQEEINNKLDDMAESGQLTDIIAQYLGLAGMIAFDTVGDMKLAENLVNGSKCHTLGYYSINDNGSAIYKIRTKTNADVINEMNLIALYDDTLVAELVIVNDTINVEQLGAKGDNTQDDTDYLQAAFSLGATNITFGHHKTYLVKGYQDGDTPTGAGDAHGVSIASNSIVDLNYSTIKVIPNSRDNYKALFVDNKNHIVIKNGYIVGDIGAHTGTSGQWGHGLCIKDSSDIIVENINASLCWGDGFNIQGNGDSENTNITFRDCVADDNRRQGLSVSSNLHDACFENCQFINTGKTAATSPSAGVDLEPELDQRCYNISFINCILTGNKGSAIQLRDSNNITIDNCFMKDNIAEYSQRIFFITDTCYDIYVNNTTIDRGSVTKRMNQIDCSGNIYFNNVLFRDIISIVRLKSSVKSIVLFDRCTFELLNPAAYNSGILLSETSNDITNDTQSELIFNNCYFDYLATGDLREWIKVEANNHFGKLIITNNKFIRGKVAINNPVLNSYISNNEFIQISKQTINLSGSTNTHVFTNNMFEQCNYDTATASLIYNDAATNFILKDNTSINHTLNSVLDIASPAHSPTAFLQTTSTASIDIEENNNVGNIV